MRTLAFALTVALVPALLPAAPAAPQAVRQEMLVSTEWLAAHPGAAKVLHVGDRAGYDAGHIPGAVLLEMSTLLVTRDGVPNELPPLDSLEAVFRAAGIGNTERIVLYSPDLVHAERAWFTLDYLGHGSRAAILDGGLAKWVAEKRPVSTEATTVEPAPFRAEARPEIVTGLAAMREIAAKGSAVLIDSRPPEQFADPGHIRGAQNIPVAAHFAGGVYLEPKQLRALYESAGVTKDTANVTYCRSGMQAALGYFVLRYLGYEASVYDGSFSEWSKAGEKPE